MLAVFVRGIDRCRKIGMGEATNGNAIVVGPMIAFPVHTRSAIRAEVKPDFEAAIGHAAVYFMLSADAPLTG